MSDEHVVRGRVDAVRWSYERGLDDSSAVTSVTFARIALGGARFDLTGHPVTQATVKFAQPSGSTIGKLAGSDPHRLSVTLPPGDLASFTAAVQARGPLFLEAAVYGGDNSVIGFTLITDGF